MDSLSSRCAEESNSTDCLLRTLIKFLEDAQKANDGEFEWDPITFGFTVPIAIFAAGFSLIAIIQAILAAGPGRRKSNSEAIGTWSKKTKWRWQWWNLGFLHIAKTPILTIKNMTKWFRENSNLDPNITDGSFDRHKIYRGGSAASWLIFLDKMGLSTLELEGDATKTTFADYLPGDLLAAPALAQVGLAFLFITIADPPLRVLGADTRYPTLIGWESQFEIRQHPSLGSVGAFSSHSSSNPRSKTVSKQDFEAAAKNYKGVIRLFERPMLRDWPIDKEVDITESYEFNSRFIKHRNSCKYASELPNMKALEQCRETTSCESRCSELYYFRSSSQFSIIYGFMFSDIPGSCPAVFPYSAASANSIFEAVSICSLFSTECDKIGMSTKHIMSKVLDRIKRTQKECPFKSTQDKNGCSCEDIIHACGQLSNGFSTYSDWINAFSINRLTGLRDSILKALVLLDGGIKEVESEVILCHAIWLFVDIICIHEVRASLSERGLKLRSKSMEWIKNYCQMFDQNEGSNDWTKLGLSRAENESILKNLSARLFTRSERYNLESTSKILKRLGKRINDSMQGKTEVPSNGHPGTSSDRDTEASDAEIIYMLGWRMILVSLLYFTAQDTTPLLNSGVWRQVIPML